MPLSHSLLGEALAGGGLLSGLWASLAHAAPVRPEHGSDTIVHSGPEAVAAAAPAWRELEANGGAPTAFQRLDVAEAALPAHLAAGDTPHIAVVRQAGRPVVLLATVTGRVMGLRVVRFLGDPLIQFGDALAVDGAQPRHFDAAWRAIADPSKADVVLLRKVRDDGHLSLPLTDRAAPIERLEAPFVDLTDPHAGADRQPRELRRLRRRLCEQGEPRLDIVTGPALKPLAAKALSWKRQWLAERGLASYVIGNSHWEDALLALGDRDGAPAPLAAACLYLTDRPAAIEIGFLHEGCWHAYLGAIEPAFAKWGPGRVQMADLMARLRSDGLRTYDLMAPADAYKRGLASGTAAVSNRLAALTLRGRLAMPAARFAPRIKSVLGRIPEAVRSRVFVPFKGERAKRGVPALPLA